MVYYCITTNVLCWYIRRWHVGKKPRQRNELYQRVNYSIVKNSRAEIITTAPSKKDVIVPKNISEQPVVAIETATGPYSGCDLVYSYAWDTATARAVCLAESGGNPNAYNGANYNGTNDAGLMQINSIHVISGLIGDQERFNPELNMKAAYAIYKGSGFRAWAAYTSGAYLKYL